VPCIGRGNRDPGHSTGDAHSRLRDKRIGRDGEIALDRPAGEYDTLLRELYGDLLARFAKDRLKVGMDVYCAIDL